MNDPSRRIGDAPLSEALAEEKTIAPTEGQAAAIGDGSTLPPQESPADNSSQSFGHTAAFTNSPAPTEETPLPKIPGHEVLGVLGRGGMGVVSKARQLGLNRLVALKMILSGAHASERERSRFLTEAEAVARLRHPNIVQIFQIGEHAGLPYFSLEYCDSGSLAALLDRTPLPPSDAAQIVRTLAEAMQVAHDEGIIHRDLKPGNVLLTVVSGQLSVVSNAKSKPTSSPTTGHWPLTTVPKITDFGLAKMLDEAGQTASGAVVGTPSYMAPEQASGDSKAIGPPADIYALGAILYECLTGRAPFKAATQMETIHQVVNVEPVLPSQLNPRVPRDLETICLKCVEKELGQRYASAADLAEDLRRFLAGEPIRARPVSRVERTWRWCRRKPALAGLVAALTIMVVVGIGGAFWYVQDRADRHADQLSLAADSERKKALTEQGIRAGLDQAQKARQGLLDLLGKPGGVFKLLDEPSRWQAPIVIAQTALDRAKALCDDEPAQIDPALGTSVQRKGPQFVGQVANLPVERQVGNLPHNSDPHYVLRQKTNDLSALLRQDEADRQLSLHLEEIRKDIFTTFEGNGFKLGDGKYADAFAEAHLAVLADDPQAIAARIGASAIKEQLVAALDIWALAAWKTDQRPLAQRLLEVARLASPEDVWGNRFRELKIWRDPVALANLVKDLSPAKVSPQMVGLVSHLIPQNDPVQLAWLRKAQALHPNDFWLNLHLAFVIGDTDRSEAIGFLRAAVAVRPDNFAAHFNLGSSLRQERRLDEAIAEFEKAIALNPRRRQLYYHLGRALDEQNRLPEALSAFQNAALCSPQSADAHYDVGVALDRLKRRPEAILAYQQAVARDPKHVNAYNNLGIDLSREQRLPEAVAALQKAAELNPGSADVHNNLGAVLLNQNRLAEAAAAFEKAVEVNPKHDNAHFNLGMCLRNQLKLAQAGDVLQKAAAINPKMAQVHALLGEVLLRQGKFAEAEAATQKELALLAPGQTAPARVLNQLEDCRRLQVLEKQLPLVLAEKKTAGPAELLVLAQLCQEYRKQYATAVRLCQKAFKAQPALESNMVDQLRYHAACIAVLAGSGQGEEAAQLGDEEKLWLRRQARAWLQADLLVYVQWLKEDKKATQVLKRLRHWQENPDLAWVRGAKELSALRDDERQTWEKLWLDVGQLVKEGVAAK